MAKDLKTVYDSPTEEDAQLALTEFNDVWGAKYPHITQSWSANWNELATFLNTQSLLKSLSTLQIL